MINKEYFCKCAEALRKYSIWERKLYNCGIDLACTPFSELSEQLHLAMCDFDIEWSYDAKLGFDWIIQWSFDETPPIEQTRHGRTFNLEEAGALYDFLTFMNERGWDG